MTNIRLHFSQVAHRYRSLRTTDPEPIRFIHQWLQELPEIKAADVGCGAGRYDLKLFEYLGEKLFLHCLDTSLEMLHQSRNYLIHHDIRKFAVIRSIARHLPLKEASLDCIFTFNAIHHFNLLGFLREVSRVLRQGGYLFIYTRLRSQNAETIWGKYFPAFTDKETRLYELHELERWVHEVPALVTQRVQFFAYNRFSSLDTLTKLARNHHYSTFYLYDSQEFEEALNQFQRRLERDLDDLNNIRWQDHNTLLVAQKSLG